MRKTFFSCLPHNGLVRPGSALMVQHSHRTSHKVLPCKNSASCLRRPITRSLMDEQGLDSDGKFYHNSKEMWIREAGEGAQEHTTDESKKRDWYQKGISYWEGIEASVNGVLGGYESVNDRDVLESNAFLVGLLKNRIRDREHLVALDCGAGVGRVTKNLLLRHFHEVDLVEPVKHFLDTAQANLTSVDVSGDDAQKTQNRAANFYCTPLQEFTPEVGRYDVIWVQWCIGHLTDCDFISFFNRAKVGLKPNGFFVLKENIASQGFVVDKVDNSVTRSDSYFQDLFRQAGLLLYRTRLQKGFPSELFAVRMYALTIPSSPTSHESTNSRVLRSSKTRDEKGSAVKTRAKPTNQPRRI